MLSINMANVTIEGCLVGGSHLVGGPISFSSFRCRCTTKKKTDVKRKRQNEKKKRKVLGPFGTNRNR